MGHAFPKAGSVGLSFLLGALVASYSAFVRRPGGKVRCNRDDPLPHCALKWDELVA